ncbi:MAG: DEAD/DEAH box helicase [SAR324 cluster bacterium]
MEQTVTSTQPVAVSPSFGDFPLAEPLLRGLAAIGFSQPTEIQAQALPVALQGRDIMACSLTGTGKTAAFVLPALQRLLTPAKAPGRGPRVLVLTPTRELASQVESVVQALAKFARLKVGLVVGGVSYEPQERLLRGPVDVLVATPGRLIDHLEHKLVDFSRLELLVLDEADRMLDMGFIEPVKRIAAALPKDRQTLLFSATFEGPVHSIAKQLLRDPVTLQLATVKLRHGSITHRVHPVSGPEHKQALLKLLLADPAMTQALIFTATKRGAGKLAERLTLAGHPAAALHGNMRQSARNRTVHLLREGKVKLLVATDVAARGIDVDGISHVINYELPMVAEDYIHRTGRTGRNGATGTAISLIGPDDRTRLANIERLIGRRIEQKIVAVSVPQARPEQKRGAGQRMGVQSDRTGRPRPGAGASGSSRQALGPSFSRAPQAVAGPARRGRAAARANASRSGGQGWR